MGRSFWWWMFGNAISQFGDWLFLVGTYWLLVDGFGQNSWQGNFQGLVGAGAALLVGFLGLRLRRRWSPRAVVLGFTVFCLLKSGAVSALCYSNQLTVNGLLLFAVLSSVVATLCAPSVQYFHRSLTGEAQHAAASLVDILFWVSRLLVGVAVAMSMFSGIWLLFAIDALSFLPLLFILALVGLPHRNQKVEEEGSEATMMQGLRFSLGDQRTFVLLVSSLITMCTCSIVFTLVAEVIRKELKGTITDYGITLAITGVVGLLGSAVTYRIAHSSPKVKSRVYLLTSLLSPLAVMSVGLSESLPGLWITYGIFCFVVCPRGTLTEAQLRLVPLKDLGGLGRFREVLSRSAQPAAWFLLSYLGNKAGFSARNIVVIAASLGLLLSIVLFAWAATKPGLLKNLFTPQGKEVD